MSRRICSLLAVAVAAGACDGGRRVDLCARDTGVAAAVAGGQLRLTVRDVDGRPLRSATVAADRPSTVSLGQSGAIVAVEGLSAAGELVAAGRAQIGGGSSCVCIRRVAWRSFSTWQDAAGTYHDGPAAGFFVGADAGPAIVQATPLLPDRAAVAAGDTLTVKVAYANSAGVTLGLEGVAIVAAPPGASHLRGVVSDFSPLPLSSIAAGATAMLSSTRTFGAADPPGTWQLFARYKDALGVAHDGPAVELTVGAAAMDALVPQTPIALDKASINAGDTLIGRVTYRNPTAQATAVQRLVLTSRPPGATNLGGPFDDFSPPLTGQSVGPGATLDAMATRAFVADDDPCADVECVVTAGQCVFTDRGAARPDGG